MKISPVCNKCRERHVRCDGGPQCSRCRQAGALCQFRPSRRGMRTRSQPRSGPSSGPSSGDCHSDVALSARSWTPSQGSVLTLSDNSSPLHGVDSAFRSQSASSRPSSTPMGLSSYLTDLFYANFYPKHPFVLPREHLAKELAAAEQCPLKPVIEYIGTFYHATLDRSKYQNRADALLATHPYRSDGLLVQAMLVFAIGLRSDGHVTQADMFLRKAHKCAVAIGMNDHAYSCLGTGGQIIQVDSWRRTWLVLRELCQVRQSCVNPNPATYNWSPRTSAEYTSSAGLDAPLQNGTCSISAPSMAWRGFGDGHFTAGNHGLSLNNFRPMLDDRYREGNKDCVLPELRAEAGVYGGVELYESDRHSIAWGHHQESRSMVEDNQRPSLPENDFTRMLFGDLRCL